MGDRGLVPHRGRSHVSGQSASAIGLGAAGGLGHELGAPPRPAGTRDAPADRTESPLHGPDADEHRAA